MNPSVAAINAAGKVVDEENTTSEEADNLLCLSNESMPSLQISEGVISPVDKSDMPGEYLADSEQQNQLDINLYIDTEAGVPVISSSSDWEIERRGDFVDSLSSPPASPCLQTNQWLRSAPSPRHNENMDDTSSIDTSSDDTTTPLKSQNYQDSHAATPPNPPFTPTRSSTPLSYYTRTTTDDKKSWLDPFPTPDIFSAQGPQVGSEEWNRIIKSIPQLPSHEEFSTLRPVKGNSNLNVTNTLSCPDLDVLAGNTSSFRRVSSEASLPVMKRNSSLETLMKRPSMEDFWTALRAGPDGNGIDNEIYEQRYDWDESILRTSSSIGDIYRQDSNQYVLVDRGGRKKIIKSIPSSPFDNTDDSVRKQNVSNLSAKYRGYRSTSVDPIRNNSSTLTNVTGAGLAKELKLLRQQRQLGAMPPGRIRSFLDSPTVSRVRTSAQERVFSPVRIAFQQSSAAKLVRNTRRKLVERKERRRQRRLARMREPPPSWWIVIPADHPYKIAWDVLTMLWSLLGAYRTHIRIRDRVFDQSPLIMLTEIWFTLDIILNFVTEHKTRNGEVIRDGKTIWARYLTTWFVIDSLSLIPWERIYVRPIVEKIKRRNIFQKTFFRSRAVVRVSRVLRGRHIKLFGRVSKHTGTPLRRMVALIIKYVPKYWLFLRNMKGALAVRSLRLVHWLHNIYKKIWVKAKSGINFRRKSMTVLALEKSNDDDDSDSDEDINSESDNDGIADDASENGFRNNSVYPDSVSSVVRRRCYSSVELSGL